MVFGGNGFYNGFDDLYFACFLLAPVRLGP